MLIPLPSSGQQPQSLQTVEPGLLKSEFNREQGQQTVAISKLRF
ncbi:MAG: hypothetical protein QNJ60_14185 [Xenococcaceae cyanobacterium MO_188.B19]|nr:hypothetical protein [Xenococcaceae cyanobacterium MO_188.B19]